MTSIAPCSTVSEARSVEIDLLDVRVSSVFHNRASKVPGGIRGVIDSLSDASRNRLVYTARNLYSLASIVTVTYPGEEWAASATGGDYMTDGRVVKEQLRRLRQWLTRRDCSGLWVLEFQKRGAPHFHIFLDRTLSPGQVDDLHSYWFQLVGSSCPHHKARGVDSQTLRKQHSAAAYAAKYTSKQEQKEVPERYKNVGRFWGKFGFPPEEPTTTYVASLKEILTLARFARRAEKAKRRDLNLSQRRKFRHLSGTRYDVAQQVLAYAKCLYKFPDNPRRIRLVFYDSPNPASGPRELVSSGGTGVPRRLP